MAYGIKTKTDGDYCIYCNAKIVSFYDFCPKCGSPLTKSANELKQQRTKALKIELLDELAYKITDEKSLKIILEKLKEI